eukprot:1528809-Rhodomonas_salina.1
MYSEAPDSVLVLATEDCSCSASWERNRLDQYRTSRRTRVGRYLLSQFLSDRSVGFHLLWGAPGTNTF